MSRAELVLKAYAAPMGMNYRVLHEHCTDISLPDVVDSSLFGRIGKKVSNIQLNEDALYELESQSGDPKSNTKPGGRVGVIHQNRIKPLLYPNTIVLLQSNRIDADIT